MDYRWDDLRIFRALYRHRTLGGAGAKLGLDASTVSRRLAGLEEALGATLFKRARDGVTATVAAEMLLEAAEEAERAANAVLLVAEGLEARPEGVVRVTAPPLLIDAMLAPALPSLRRKHPAVRLELIASIAYADLTRREADLALRSVRPAVGDLVGVRVSALSTGLYAAPALAATLGVVEDWRVVPWAIWSDELAHLPAARWLKQHCPDAAPALRSNSLGGLVTAAATGEVAVLSVGPVCRRFGLQRVPCSPAREAELATLPREETWLVGHRALRAVPRIAAVWSFLLEECAALTAEDAA